MGKSTTCLTRFGRYYQDGKAGSSFIGFVTHDPGGDTLWVHVPRLRMNGDAERVTLPVQRHLWKPVDASEVRGGLMHAPGHHRDLGHGYVVKEENRDGELHVALRQGEHVTDYVPVSEVRFSLTP